MSDNNSINKDHKDHKDHDREPKKPKEPKERDGEWKEQGAGCETGYSKTADTQRLSRSRQNISPSVRKRGSHTYRQIKRVCQCVEERLGKLSHKEKSKALLALILDQEKAPENSKLYYELEKLKGLLTIFKQKSLEGLNQLAQGKTSKVLVDAKRQVAYKLVEVIDGEVGGTFPKEIRIRPEDNQILIRGCQNHSLLEMLKAINIANEYGSPLYTELAGLSEDGSIIICQPYIKDLEPIEMLEDDNINTSIKLLGMTPLGSIGSPFAVGKLKHKYILFDDLHGENIMKTNKGEIFLVDALATRYLTNKEIKLLRDYLPRDMKENKEILTMN